MLFQNRYDAGKQLAEELTAYANKKDTIVLALPRGGVPVGYEVAAALNLPLDVFVVRKLGVPGQEELAMGAIASGGIRVLNENVTSQLPNPQKTIEEAVEREQGELDRRENQYRGKRPCAPLENRVVILVDDGLATGATMKAAVAAVKKRNASRIIVAVPLASATTAAELNREVDNLICLATPEPFFAVGQGYDDFSQTTDEEVRDLLEKAASS